MADSLQNMKDLLQQRKMAKVVSKEELVFDFNKVIVFEDWFKDLIEATTEDQHFLTEKSKELLNVNVKGILNIGRILTEVFEFSRKKEAPEKFYLKFLEWHNIEPRKGLRHRHRWELYQKAPESAKLIIATLTIREIEELYKNQNLLEDFSNVTLEDAKEILQKNVIIKPESQIDFEPLFRYSFLEKKYQKKIDTLEKEKKELAIELLEKLEKLFKE
ncbi:hypothetical protein [Fusobacterium necrophorum]|uniref:Uncharacterized protein n=1 Tax=Fusobacterium necrophorum TaxID=859 RepID=A0A4Q2KVN9_9FUSO|nr:hypothetical protein [Fusobacterium necrophorum]RXZ68590.1 hypothetical protein EPT53_09255 [Fusobacterium necrophorum]